MKAHRILRTPCYLILISVACLLPVNVFGQSATTARISGLVSDPNGAVVSGAAVKLVDNGMKAEKTTVTNEEGRYVFASLNPGSYDITITAQGFRTTVISGVKADVTVTTGRDVTLEPGSVSETVTVSGAQEALLQTDDAAVGNTIERDRIMRLPTVNMGVAGLLLLQPAVAPGGEVSGSRADQNTFTLDGLDISDNVGFRGGFGTIGPVTAASVEEFRVTVANPNATFGRSAGAQVNLVSKRGSNSFHGSVYESHGGDHLNANSWANNRIGLKRPFLVNNVFGGTLGGPIWKEKTFFFFNYEGRRQSSTARHSRVVPTQSLRDGFLKFRDTAGNVNTINPRTFDPRGIGANPAILTYIKRLPLPNDSTFGDGLNTGGFTANLPTRLRDDYGVLRLDHQINQNWSVDARGSLFRDIQKLAGQANLLDLQTGATVSQRPKTLSVGVTGSIRPNLVNEVRVGHAYDNFVLDATSPDITAGLTGFNIAVNLAPTSQDANANIALLDEGIDVDTQRARDQSLGSSNTQITDNATWSKGTHTLQFGGSVKRITTFHFRDDKVIGSLSTPVAELGAIGDHPVTALVQRPPTCSAAAPTSCLQSVDVNRYNQFYKALLGIVDRVGFLATRDASLQPNPVGTGLINDSKLRHWEFYFADTWRMKPSVTVSYGLQYQWHTPPIDKQDRQTVLVFKDTLKLIDPQDYLAQKAAAAETGDVFNPDIAFIPIKESGRKGVFDINRKNFSPRFSVAWQPSFSDGVLGRVFGERRTVIRGGYARLYDRLNTVSSVVVPMLGVGFAQTLIRTRPTNSAGDPFRVGIDGPIPSPPANTALTSPVVPSKPFGELLSITVDPNIGDPYNHAVDFTVQRELPGNMLIEVGYLGRFARSLFQNVNLTAMPLFFKDKASGQRFAEAFDAVARELRSGVAATALTPQPWFENQLRLAGTPLAGLAGFGVTRALALAGFGGLFTGGNVSNLVAAVDSFGLSPKAFNNLQVPDLFVRTSLGRSNYNALFVTLHKRISRGLVFDVNYTLSKSNDQIGGIQNFASTFSNSFDPDIDYGPSDFDRRHILNANFVYDLPFGHGRSFSTGNWLDKVIGGWHVSGIYQASSGVPLLVIQNFEGFGGGLIFGTAVGAIPINRITTGNDVNRGVAGSGGVGTAGDPNAARPGSGLNYFANPEEAFKNFRSVNISTDGRQGRGTLRGFLRSNLDLSLGKTTTITEQVKFGIFASFFNVFNQVNFSNPTFQLSNRAQFGVVSNTFGERTIQVGASVQF